ncbi:MBL fold metallo-hydrolase [soil metagenome]
MTLMLTVLPAGPLETNAYIVADSDDGCAVLVDAPPGSADALMHAAADAGLVVQAIFITHAHWDHIGDAAALKERTGAPLLAHRLCQESLEHPEHSTFDIPIKLEPVLVDQFVDEGDTVTVGSHAFEVLHLPGHEPGHSVLYSAPERMIIGGDVLFPGGHGRIDIPGASKEEIDRSLSRLAEFPPDVTVYPGHGVETTIGAEAWLERYRGSAI